MSKLKDRLVIVTGAAQGMGRAIAVEAARQGAAWATLADIPENERVAPLPLKSTLPARKRSLGPILRSENRFPI